MDTKLVPYISLGDFHFGDTQAEIKKKHGVAAITVIDDIMEQTREQRCGMVLEYVDKKLKSIVVSKHVPICYNGAVFYPDGDPLAALSAWDTPYTGKNGSTVLFPKLGICLSGFTGKKVPEGKLLIAFCKEELDFYKLFCDV